MKKLIYCAAALATALFAGSCQQELLDTPAGENTVTYTVEVPGVATKAIADGKNVDRLYYEVYMTDANTKKDLSNATLLYKKDIAMVTSQEATSRANVTLNLVQNQNYTVLFWAQCDLENPVYDVTDLRNVRYISDATVFSNHEDYAAFYSVDYISDSTPRDKKVYLQRPFAQLNIGTTINPVDYNKDPYRVALENSMVKVKNVPTKFNVATSEVDGDAEFTFAMGKVINNENLVVNNTEYNYVAMNYMFAGANRTATVEYWVEAKVTTQNNVPVQTNLNKSVVNVPLKENYRTNIVGNLLSSSTQYEIVVDADFNEPSDDVYVTEVASSEELQAALHQDTEHIVVDLGSYETKAIQSVEYTVQPTKDENGNFVWGGATTKTITINGNGNKLNFNYTNGDWQGIKCCNPEAKIIINNATLTNSGKNGGAWNRHDLYFINAIELNDVTSDKAFALRSNSKLTNVRISDVGTSEAYGIWISPVGQTVELDRVTITPSEGKTTDRAIKIDEQYLDASAIAKVTLNVKNSTFVSQKKSAVLVKTSAGAIINWAEGNNIEGVAADPINAVWVDANAANTYDLVEVNGATKVLEGAMKSVLVKTSEQLQEAVNNAGAGVNEIGFGADITGNVTIPQNENINIIINGLGKKYDGTITVDGNSRHTGAETLVIKNVNFEHSGSGLYFIEQNDAAEAVRYPHNVTVEYCTFKGDGTNVICGVRYRQGYNIAVKNCTAEGLFLFMWTTGCQNITVDNVDVIDSYKEGGFSLGVKDQITVKNSKVVASAPYGYGVRIDGDANGTWNIADNNFTAEAPVIVRKSKTAHTLNLSGNTLTTTKDYQVIVCANDNYKAGQELVEPTVKYVATGTDGLTTFPIRIIHEPSGLIWDGSNAKKFWVKNAEQLRNAVSYFNGQTHSNEANIVTLELEADIDLAGQDWTPWDVMWITLNGNNHTISNINVSAAWRSGLFGYLGAATVNDLTLKNVTVSGAQAGILAGSVDGVTVNNVKIAGENVVNYLQYSTANYTETYGGIGSVTGIFTGNTVNAEILSSATVTLNYNDIVTNASYLNKLIGYTPGNYSNNGTITNSGSVESVGVINSKGVSYNFDYEASTLNIESKAEYGNTVYRGLISDGSNYGITNIVVSEGITRLNNRAFCKNTQLKTVSLPITLTYIDEGVFQESGFTSITIPGENVTLGKQSIAYLPNLETITIRAKKVTIGDFCARACPKLKSVYIYSDEVAFAKPESQYFTNLENDNTSSITYYVASQAIADAVKASIATGHAKGAVIKNIDGTQTYYTIQ